MSNRDEHILLGALLGLGTYVAAKRSQGEEVDLGNAMGCSIAGAVVAALPDIIEPATGPNHRSSAHSLAVAHLVASAAKGTWDSPAASSEQKAVAASIAAAYLSHLLADSVTPASIPIL